MRHLFLRLFLLACGFVLLAMASLLIPDVRSYARGVARSIIRPEPPAPITPIAISTPDTASRRRPVRLVTAFEADTATATSRPAATTTPWPSSTASSIPTSTPEPSATLPPTSQAAPPAPPAPSDTALPTPEPTATPEPEPTSTPVPVSPPEAPPAPAGPVVVNGRAYDVYIPAANKEGQAYQYSCEFDAAWVILQTFGVDVQVDDLIAATSIDRSIEPYIEETAQGALIHGGNITSSYSGDYTSNFLARSTGEAMRPVFEQYGMTVWPVRDRTAIQASLQQGALIWMKTTVDFKPWRPATWVMPDGRTHQTVLGNDHAVVVMGYNAQSVVIRDVLGPTSSNWQRPYEYEVDWATFLASWEAQSFDGLAVVPATDSWN